MKEVSFTFRGKPYKATLYASKEQYPHYYWCFIDDPELVKELGDCISFQQDKGGQLRVSELYPEPYQELVEHIKTLVEQTIRTTTTA